jgi:hypothetical protein
MVRRAHQEFIRLKIAFDLDGTLIPAPGAPMAVERPRWPARLISAESLRAGAPRLLRALRRRGHEVWIYTTSLRSAARLRLWFSLFGVRLDGVVTQATHAAVIAEIPLTASKYPPAFGIDLLVDDAAGVALEGRRFGFAVLILSEDDTSWCARVLTMVRAAEQRRAVPDYARTCEPRRR